ncbi:hypothetical protein DB30_05629 [Enhygromyxa salina]|uniref:Uncharacterized protein n=1 Tax=Enhygromyxa salina TaxID=215803 RepID=A0A0C1ZWK0_9BACT|nr:hypothetical protein [Enhygromyxa salina]KIG15433.1 hypothetical protein DB30_05629 [Enhygromyxa salina]
MSGDEGAFAMGDELAFEHVGTMACSEAVLICDVEYFPANFAGMRRGPIALDLELEIQPGTWQVLIAHERDADQTPRFVLLSLDAELDEPTPLDHAEAVGLLRVDSGRITAIDPALRDDPIIQTAVLEAPREQVPCMLRALDAEPTSDPRGVLLDIDAGGVCELYAPPGRPCRSLLIMIPG